MEQFHVIEQYVRKFTQRGKLIRLFLCDII